MHTYRYEHSNLMHSYIFNRTNVQCTLYVVHFADYYVRGTKLTILAILYTALRTSSYGVHCTVVLCVCVPKVGLAVPPKTRQQPINFTRGTYQN